MQFPRTCLEQPNFCIVVASPLECRRASILGVDKRGEAGDDGERGVARTDRSRVAGVQLDVVVVGVRSVRNVA